MTLASQEAAALDAAIEHVGQAVTAGSDTVALGKLLSTTTLLTSIEASQARDHPLLADADAYLATASERATGECQYHVREARALLWALGGEQS